MPLIAAVPMKAPRQAASAWWLVIVALVIESMMSALIVEIRDCVGTQMGIEVEDKIVAAHAANRHRHGLRDGGSYCRQWSHCGTA